MIKAVLMPPVKSSAGPSAPGRSWLFPKLQRRDAVFGPIMGSVMPVKELINQMSAQVASVF